MNYIKTDIEGPVIIEPRVFGDERGYFFEAFRDSEFRENVADICFIQDNESLSARRGVIRGLHFQKGEYAQAKLVRVVKGRVQDVAVDLREGSPTFGKYISVVLDGASHRMLYIPHGFAHGYAVLENDTIFQYKCDRYYNPASEAGYRWNDPAFGVEWMLDEDEIILSPKDASAPFFKPEGR
ncbi:MAG: dTDP-4-dehydrorhamnose 3,5-epimerase [Bacteroidales bacterium]|nr:dTDP-4-dehydrorhamnose 3,5-epimerase [Bacteroidales bacterium]